jgi:hypothetical protein
LAAHRFAKLPHALARSPRHVRQPLWAKHEQGDEADEQEVYRVLYSHRVIRLKA